jgi:hypothetical protein
MNISHSKVELFNTCGFKYKLKYIDKLEADKTYTPLLFGGAVDQALNYLLIQTKNNKPIDMHHAKSILIDEMYKWSGQNELVFFKSEMPEDEFIEGDYEGNQIRVWNYLCKIGQMMLDVYVEEIIPLFDSIVDVQITKNIKNEDGDNLVLIMDFIGKLKDGRILVVDNKTSGDIKKAYPKTAVKNSQQLAIYTEHMDSRLAGYIALSKKLKDGKIEWKMVVDEVPEEQSQKAFDKIDSTLRSIKNNEFDKNPKSCFSFGRKCEYWDMCKKDDSTGLVKRGDK